MCDLSCHKLLYKSRNTEWKTTCRQRFRQRIKENRDRLLAQNRGQALRAVHLLDRERRTDADPGCRPLHAPETETFFCGLHQRALLPVDDEADLDDMLRFMGKIDEDEMNEELLRDHYNEAESFYYENVCDASDSMDFSTNDSRLCPVCRMNFQVEHTDQLICGCLLKIDDKLDKASICHLRQQLNEGMLRHVQNCSSHVTFSSITTPYQNAGLQMNCSVCKFVFEVI